MNSNLSSIYDTTSKHYKWILERYNTIGTDIKTDALVESAQPGAYVYDADSAIDNKPDENAGAIFSFGYNEASVGRLAITQANKVYTSIYIYGKSYGTWKQIT